MSVDSDDSDDEEPSKKAAVAMSVGVGSFSDPEDLEVQHVPCHETSDLTPLGIGTLSGAHALHGEREIPR